MQYRAFPPRHSLVHFHLQIHQQSSLSSQRDATSTERLRGPFLPFLGDGSWRSGLARRKGVSETAGAQIGFAKRLITRPGIVPTKPHGILADFPSPGVLSRTSPVITAWPFCPWTLLSRPGRCPSLGTTHHSLSLPAVPSPTLAFRGRHPQSFNERGPGPSPDCYQVAPPQASKAPLLWMEKQGRGEGGHRSRIRLTPALAPGWPCSSCSPL